MIDPVLGECKFGKKIKGDMAPFLKAVVPHVTFENIPAPEVKKPKEPKPASAETPETETNKEEA